MSHVPSMKDKIKFFGRRDCVADSKLFGKETHCPCWPEEECCYCGKPPKEDEK